MEEYGRLVRSGFSAIDEDKAMLAIMKYSWTYLRLSLNKFVSSLRKGMKEARKPQRPKFQSRIEYVKDLAKQFQVAAQHYKVGAAVCHTSHWYAETHISWRLILVVD